MTVIRPIHTEAEYEAALLAIRPYIENEPEPGTDDADRYDLLAMVIEKYEDEHHAIGPADPVEVVKLVMETNGYDRGDLAGVIGGPSRTSEFLNRRRGLSLTQVQRLRDAWNIPADLLIPQPADA